MKFAQPLALLATTFGLLLPAVAQAQAQPQAPGLIAARSLAATCANCHGTNGVSRGEVASLAGAPAEATIAKMAAYKSGALSATVMHQIAKGYTDEQIQQLAAYFASQPSK
ncbi:MAG TPA: c-type cytochrome [Rubrivivax sp.]|jgi:cytochrome c553|nr:c-type cytochrome [Rubrivivax sp.]